MQKKTLKTNAVRRPGEFAKSIRALAQEFNVSHECIRLWIKLGAPNATASGFYPLDAWHKWVVRNGKSQTLGQVSEKDRLIARQIHLKNQKLELEVQRARGQLMHVEEVRSKLFLTFNTCRRTQMHMVASLAPRLAGMSPCEIKAEMTSALNDSYSAIRRWADSMSRLDVESSNPRSVTPSETIEESPLSLPDA
jgi:hypothetical protein